jgi:murein L,D-transpeptidase YcbB/YkuD
MAAGTQQQVYLKTPIPVFVVYATAQASQDGRVFFYRDLYKLDSELKALIEAPPAVRY